MFSKSEFYRTGLSNPASLPVTGSQANYLTSLDQAAACCTALNNFTITQAAFFFALAHRSQCSRSPGSTIGWSFQFFFFSRHRFALLFPN
jgi:hypothetical protein